MVNEKMINTVYDMTDGIEYAEEIAQAVINAAWTDFDPEDESTWPKTEMAPSGDKWVIQATNLMGEIVFASMKFHLNTGWRYHVHYADPADIMRLVE